MKFRLLSLVLLPLYTGAQQKDNPRHKIEDYLSKATNFYGMQSKKPISREKVIAHLEEARTIIDEGSRLDQASAQIDTLRDTVATIEKDATTLNLSLMSLHSQISLSEQPDILIGELLKKNKSNLDSLTQCNQRARTLIQTSCSDSTHQLEKEIADLEASVKGAHEKSEKIMSVLTQYVHNKEYPPKKTFLTFKEQLNLIDVEKICTVRAIDAAENLAAYYSTVRKKIQELQKISALQYTTENVCLKIGIKPPVTSAQYNNLTQEFQELEKTIKEKVIQKSDEIVAKYLRPLDKSTPEEQIEVLSELRDILKENNLELPCSQRIDALITKLERKIAVQKEQRESKKRDAQKKNNNLIALSPSAKCCSLEVESLSNDQLDEFILYGPAFVRRVLENPIAIITGQESKPANVLFFFTHEKEKKIAARKAHARNGNKALLFTNYLHAKVNGKPTLIAFKTFDHETNTNKYQLGYANNGDCYIKSQDSDEYSKISRIVGYDYDEEATEEDGAESDESENHSEQEEDFGE